MNDHVDHERIDQLAAAALETLRSRRTVPASTYRVQMRGDAFTFRDAAAAIGYLNELGASHLYCSPYLRAREGSTHGYDIVDPSVLNPALGSEDDFRDMVQALRNAGMGHILDMVPNHMGISGGENGWWQDVLENGPSSPYAAHFDIDWRPAKKELRNRILLPMLGEQYGQVLEQGHLQLEFDAGAFWVRCYDARLPLEPKSYPAVLSRRLDVLRAHPEVSSEALQELESILTACDYLPDFSDTDPVRTEERRREKEVIKARLERLTSTEPIVEQFIRENLTELNGDPDRPQSFDALDELLGQQVYRLAHWKAASDEINYRRFFDVNELAAICVEDLDVFEDTHELVMQLLVRGDLDGLRIDHVDGLLDPTEYLRRLQRGYVVRLGRWLFEQSLPTEGSDVSARERQVEQHAGARSLAVDRRQTAVAEVPAPEDWKQIEPLYLRRLAEQLGWREDFLRPADVARESSEDAQASGRDRRPTRPLYVVVEKILEPDEQLPPNWPVAGTTGYGFLNRTTEMLVDAHGYRELAKGYRRFTGLKAEFPELVYDCKRLILRVAMAAELQLLAARLNRLSERHRRTRDFTLNNLRDALQEVLACFPVYRTYITSSRVSERDRHFINIAISRAQRRNPALDVGLFDFIRKTLLLEPPLVLDERHELEQEIFVGRFQQASSPVMAKGTEDTAFYRFFPLCALNEVGGSPAPDTFGVPQFHEENRKRAADRPSSLITTTTHDTKRTEDTRARICVLSQIPRVWRQAVSRWARMNRAHVRRIEQGPAPSRNDEYLFYQTLVGIWPIEPPDEQALAALVERMQQYLAKATHEAKQHTSWINPDSEYDAAVREFVAAVLPPGGRSRFIEDFQRFQDRTLDWGLYTALSQVFVKLMSPGVPDIYQGQELWDFSLVDPDNRQPVDYGLRQRLLDELQTRYDRSPEARAELVRELGRTPRDPRLKLFVTWRTLQFRRRSRRLFERGEYLPLQVSGPHAESVCAFAWRCPEEEVDEPTVAIAIIPRLIANLTPLDEESRPLPPLGPDVWEQTSVSLEGIGPLDLMDVFTGIRKMGDSDRLELDDLLAEFPVALLSNRTDLPENPEWQDPA